MKQVTDLTGKAKALETMLMELEKDPDVRSIMILSCDENDFVPEDVDPALKKCSKPHASNRKAGKLILEKQGYEVVEAESGFAALERIQEMPVDLVLMDIQMPEMDGYETTHQIRQMGGFYSQVPIIALTANATTKDREKCLKAGMADYISKPFKPGKLRGVVQQLLKNEGENLVKASAVFDATEFWKRYSPDLTMAKRFLKSFSEDLPEHLKRLESYAKERNLEAIGEEAHNLKGASAYASAKVIEESAEKMMKAAAIGRMEEIKEVLLLLRKQEKEFNEEISKWIHNLRKKTEEI